MGRWLSDFGSNFLEGANAMNIVKFCSILLAAGWVAACSTMPEAPARSSALREVADWSTLPAGEEFGQVTGIGVDSHNHVFVFHRAGRTWTDPFPIEAIPNATVFMLDGSSGKLLAKWGSNRFIMPHGLAIDANDNVWLTDVGLEQVFAFSHDGKLLKTLGTAKVSGSDGTHFGRPADVAFYGNRAYVADGYTNTRVAVFAQNGSFEKSLGGARGTLPGEVDLPHGIALGNGRIYLADRENSRLQVWSTTGKVLAVWPREVVGRPYGVDVSDNGLVAIIDGGDQPDKTAARVRLFDSNGKSLGTHDTRRAGDEANLGHDIAFGRDGALYVADTWAKRVVKLMPIDKGAQKQGNR